jgi:thermostable 8-oxoguanine DNA glycosylase
MIENEKKQKRSYSRFNAEVDALNFIFSYNDTETTELHAQLNGSTSITEDDLRRVSLWKSDRVLSVSPETLQKLNELSTKEGVTLKDALAKEVIEKLVLSQGIGFPMASAILKFINPSVFPIIDVRAYRALTGEKPYYGTYSYEKYIDYAEKISALAKKLDRPLREIDEQLYCYDQKHNGEI